MGVVFQMCDPVCFEGLTKQFRVATVNIEGGFMRVRMVGDGSPPLNAVSVAPNLEDAYVYFMDDDEAEQSQTTISDKVVRT